MESVKYEGVYPRKHNHSTQFFSFLQGDFFSKLALLNLEVDEEKESRSGIKPTMS
jgi:hypothetical protein